jgi:hypothetical protein
VGKTALLDYLADRAPGSGWSGLRVSSREMELAFAGLHQLLAPMLDHLRVAALPD